jgi:hypothetical protein
MKQRIPAISMLLLTGLFIWMACSKPTAFGSGLLENAVADYAFTDTLTVNCTVLREDSVISSDLTSTGNYFLCGELNDPIFGKSTSEIYTLIKESTLSLDYSSVNYTNYHLDSLVMYLELAPAGVYGDTTAMQTIHVFQCDTAIDPAKTYYSNASYVASKEIGTTTFFPRPNTKRDSISGKTTKGSFVRVPINTDFANMLLQIDSLKATIDTEFFKVVRGLKITTSANSTPGAMVAFNLNDQAFSFMRMYYKKDGDTTRRTSDYYFGGNKFCRYTHSYNGTIAGQQIGKKSDNLMYVQGMTGLKVRVDIPYAHKLTGIAVNEAKLVLGSFDPGSSPWLLPANQLVFTQKQGDSTYVLTNDVIYSLGSALTGGFAQFGGFPMAESHNGVAMSVYHLRLNDRLQKTIAGKLDSTVFINVWTQNRSPMRAVLGGPKNTTFPAKLALKYTKL